MELSKSAYSSKFFLVYTLHTYMHNPCPPPTSTPSPSTPHSLTYLEVNNYQEERTIYDVTATIYGGVEPGKWRCSYIRTKYYVTSTSKSGTMHKKHFLRHHNSETTMSPKLVLGMALVDRYIYLQT